MGPRLGRDAATRRRRTSAAWTSVVGVAAAAAIVAGCAPTPVPVPELPLDVTRHVVDGAVPGVSFAKAADVTDAPGEELVVSQFGSPTSAPGSVTIYERGDDLDSWTKVPVVTPAHNIRFPNDTEVADLDGDGLTDLIVSGGFFSCSFGPTGCGSLQWFRQGPAGEFTRHDIVPPDNALFYHRSIVVDVDGDGIDDLVTVGETFSSARTEWYRGRDLPGADRFDDQPLFIGNGGGSLPVVVDVDGDGDDDVVSPQFFQAGASVVWFERTGEPSAAEPAGTWAQHWLAGAEFGSGFELELVPDLLGDGVDRWIGTNHQNTNFAPNVESGVFRFEPGADVRQPWSIDLISSGIQSRPTGPTTLAPGLLGTGDVNSDGRTDVVVSGDGDDRLFVLLQGADATFTSYTLDLGMGQAGGAEVTDLDGDGRPEALFTSYERGVVALYEFQD